MKIKISLFTILFSAFFYSQEVETINLSKSKSELFRGVNEDITNWYLYFDNEFCYLANLELNESDVKNWFEKRKNSQNIFKGKISEQQYKTILFEKENEPETKMNFYIEIQGKDKLILTNIDDTRVYIFDRK
jgi:hypothetical protein